MLKPPLSFGGGGLSKNHCLRIIFLICITKGVNCNEKNPERSWFKVEYGVNKSFFNLQLVQYWANVTVLAEYPHFSNFMACLSV